MRLSKATINLLAVEHNLSRVKQLAPKSKVIAMIKSDAYGHGLIPVAGALKDADAFGVSVIEEAIALRESGISQKIILMTGACSLDELQSCIYHDIDIVVHQPEHLDYLKQIKKEACVSVWLKVDVGMHRLGFHVDEISEIFEQLNQMISVRKPIFLMSHLPNADELTDGVTPQNLDRFKQCAEKFKVECSLAKSAGILAWPKSHYQWVRPGILLYGISPMDGYTGEQHGLKPAMDFRSHIVAVKQLKAGDPVSYGGDWRCPEDMTVGIVGVGYSDGYPRHAKSGTPILVEGQQCQLIGRVCMDMIVVDCRAYPDVKVGDEVTLWGEGLPIERVAEYADTIAYELICHVSERVKRIL